MEAADEDKRSGIALFSTRALEMMPEFHERVKQFIKNKGVCAVLLMLVRVVSGRSDGAFGFRTLISYCTRHCSSGGKQHVRILRVFLVPHILRI